MGATKSELEALLREGVLLGRKLEGWVVIDIEGEEDHPMNADVKAWQQWKIRTGVAVGDIAAEAAA